MTNLMEIRKDLKRSWIANWELVQSYGPSALRRVRQLRGMGENVLTRRLKKHGKFTYTFQYRIK